MPIARAAGHRERENRVGADHRQQQRHAAERAECRADPGKDRAVLQADVLQRKDLGHLNIRIKRVDGAPQRTRETPRVSGSSRIDPGDLLSSRPPTARRN
jgi:hypothetical protein